MQNTCSTHFMLATFKFNWDFIAGLCSFFFCELDGGLSANGKDSDVNISPNSDNHSSPDPDVMT